MRIDYLMRIAVLFLCICMLVGCTSEEKAIKSEDAITQNAETNDVPEMISNAESSISEGDENAMNITINGAVYEIELDKNVTTEDILKNLPLNLTLTRYDEHEYYSELPFTPVFAQERTSNIKAAHVYYWDGWNAFVINFEDMDISPYKTNY